MKLRIEHGGTESPAGSGTRRSAQAFSLIELLTVISIIGLLAGIGAGVAGVASRKMKESRVKAELNMLVTAIEDYKARFGHYPPDNNKDGTNANPALHGLYYELMGTLSTNQGAAYRLAGQLTWVQADTIPDFLNLKGFVNSVTEPDRPKCFLQGLKAAQTKDLQLTVQQTQPFTVLVVPVDWPAKEAQNPAFPAPYNTDAKFKRINPWRYVSTQPTNNPNGFDLWADVIIGKQRRLFGNWRD